MNEQIKIAHLGFIQGVINRMGSNSFAAKGWCVVIIAALIALVSSKTTGGFIGFSLVTIILFWGLDAYFVRQERMYRDLYKSVVANDASIPEFSMETEEKFGTNTSLVKAMRSETLLYFYTPFVVAVIALRYVM